MKQQGLMTKLFGIFILCFSVQSVASDFTYQTFRFSPSQAGLNPTKATSLLFVANSKEGVLWAGNQAFGRCIPLSENESESQNQPISLQEGILQCKNFALKVENGFITEVLTSTKQQKLHLKLLDSMVLEPQEVTYQYPKKPRQNTTTHALATIQFHCSKDSGMQKLLQVLYQEKFDCKNAQEVFVKSAQNSIQQFFDKIAQEERKSREKTIEEFLKTSSFETSTADSLYYFDENLLAFSIEDYFYSGGAHGISHKRGVLLSKNNKILDLKTKIDFNNPELKSLLWQAYQEYLKNIGEEAFVDFESFKVSEEILLDYDSFIFLYQPYELMPYAYGILELRIPLDKMARFGNFSKTPLQSLFAK